MYPAGIIFDVKGKRYHPVLFVNHPMPGPDGFDSGRYKSMGHHTEGFATLPEAEAYLASPESKEKGVVDYGVSFLWDGEGVPSYIEFFGDRPSKSPPRPPVPEELVNTSIEELMKAS